MDPYARDLALVQLVRAGVTLEQLRGFGAQERKDLGDFLFGLYPKRKVDIAADFTCEKKFKKEDGTRRRVAYYLLTFFFSCDKKKIGK